MAQRMAVTVQPHTHGHSANYEHLNFNYNQFLMRTARPFFINHYGCDDYISSKRSPDCQPSGRLIAQKGHNYKTNFEIEEPALFKKRKYSVCCESVLSRIPRTLFGSETEKDREQCMMAKAIRLVDHYWHQFRSPCYRLGADRSRAIRSVEAVTHRR